MGLKTSTQTLVADKGCQKSSQNVTKEFHEYNWVEAAVWSEQTRSGWLCRCSPERKCGMFLLFGQCYFFERNTISFWNEHRHLAMMCVCVYAHVRVWTNSSDLLGQEGVLFPDIHVTASLCRATATPFWLAHQPFQPATYSSHHTYTSPPFIPYWLLFLGLPEAGDTEFLSNVRSHSSVDTAAHLRRHILAWHRINYALVSSVLYC